MRPHLNHFKYTSLCKRTVIIIFMKLYTVMKTMNIEYTVTFAINFELNNFVKIILNQEHTQITNVKVNDFKLILYI